MDRLKLNNIGITSDLDADTDLPPISLNLDDNDVFYLFANGAIWPNPGQGAWDTANTATIIAIQSGNFANISNTIAIQSGNTANSAWLAANNANLVGVSTTSISNQANLEIAISGSTYSSYEVDLSNLVPFVNGDVLYIQFSGDNGATYYSNAIYITTGSYSLVTSAPSSGVFPFGEWGSTAIAMAGDVNKDRGGLSGKLSFYPTSNTLPFHGSVAQLDAYWLGANNLCVYNSTRKGSCAIIGTINKIKLYYGTSTILSGNVHVRALKK